MARSQRPRKKYRPTGITPGFDPIHTAIVATAVFEEDHAKERVQTFKDAVGRACNGTSTKEDWQVILYNWHVVNHMACIPGVMVNGKAAGNMLGEMLIEVAARDDKSVLPLEAELMQQFVDLYESLTYNVPHRIWAASELRATEHVSRVRRQIAKEDRVAEAAH